MGGKSPFGLIARMSAIRTYVSIEEMAGAAVSAISLEKKISNMSGRKDLPTVSIKPTRSAAKNAVATCPPDLLSQTPARPETDEHVQ